MLFKHNYESLFTIISLLIFLKCNCIMLSLIIFIVIVYLFDNLIYHFVSSFVLSINHTYKFFTNLRLIRFFPRRMINRLDSLNNLCILLFCLIKLFLNGFALLQPLLEYTKTMRFSPFFE